MKNIEKLFEVGNENNKKDTKGQQTQDDTMPQETMDIFSYSYISNNINIYKKKSLTLSFRRKDKHYWCIFFFVCILSWKDTIDALNNIYVGTY